LVSNLRDIIIDELVVLRSPMMMCVFDIGDIVQKKFGTNNYVKFIILLYDSEAK
jgi:hypothetical protein